MPARVARLSVRLLGPLEVAVDGVMVSVDTRKALAIIALLAAEGRPFARDELAAMFWPEADDESARGALRRTLSTLKTAVSGAGLIIDRSRVLLDSRQTWMDLAELERRADATDRSNLEAAAVLARGPFMAGFTLRDSQPFDDWQAIRRARVESLVGDLLDRLVDARLDDADMTGAVEAAGRRAELDPLDESGQRRLIELLARSGDTTGAIRRYRMLVGLFDRELGVAPLRETTELYEAIREERLTTSQASAVVDVSPPGRAGLPLVGRDGDLAAILRTVDSAHPDGRLVVVEGEAGIGKTRLAEAVVDAVQTRGGIVLAGQAYPGESGIAYGPIAGLLRSGLDLPGGAERLASLDPVSLHETARLLELPAALRQRSTQAIGDPASARVRFLGAIADVLTALTIGPTPGIIWIDDFHHADAATLQAIAFLGRRLRGRPVVLLLAWRREDMADEASTVAGELERIAGASRVALGRLDPASIARLVSVSRQGESAGSEHDPAFLDALISRSEGLPLYIIEALAVGETDASATYRGMQELAQERINSVSEVAGQVLAAAAIIGRSFDLDILRRASGRSDVETVDAVEELVRRGLIREVSGLSDGPIRYDFGHARLRDAMLEMTSLARRRLLHRRTADALRAVVPGIGRDPVGTFAMIAAHERDAGRTVEAGEAFVEAADQAQALFANRESIDHLENALALGYPAVATVRARMGELRARLGDYPAAIADLEIAAALATPGQLAEIESMLGRIHRRRGDLAAAASHLEEALRGPDLAPSLRAQTLAERSIVALRSGQPDIAEAAAAEARIIAAVTDDPHTRGVAERVVGLVSLASGDLPTALSAFERSIAIAEHDPDPTAAIAAGAALGLGLAASGDTDDALAALTRARDRCRTIGDRHLEAAVENQLADLLHEAGRETEAMDHLKRAVSLFAEIGGDGPDLDPGVWALAAW